jgi:hypothetical protein
MKENHDYDERIATLLTELRAILMVLSDDQRLEIADRLMAGYCTKCGRHCVGRCHCDNDE